MRNKLIIGVAFASVAVVGFLAVHSANADGDTLSGGTGPVRFHTLHETYASESAADWVTNSDYVVDATMTSERAGTGDDSMVDRHGEFRVNKVYYSRDAAPKLPSTFSMKVTGWALDSSTRERRPIVVADGSPRLEVGHRYVLAVVFLEPRCNPDDGVYPGGWSPIGSWGAVPFDDAKLGKGEVEGSTSVALKGAPGSMAESVATGSTTVENLQSVLDRAPRGKRPVQPGERIGC